MADSVYGTAFLNIQPDLKNFGSALQQGVTRGGILGRVGGSAGLLMGGAMVAGVGTGLAKLGATFDDAFDTIRIGTGATGEVLEDLEGSFSEVFSSVPTDAESASTAIADLNTRLGLTGEALEDSATQFINLSRLTGTELTQNIETVSRVFGDWGVETADQTDRLDQLFRASQNTGITVDRLSSQLVKFGAPLRQLGFEFEESAALLSSFEQEGVNAELVMGSLRIALGQMARDGEPAVETFQRVVSSIEDAGDASEANALALELFGARAGPDMAAAIREGRFEVDDLVSTIADGTETIQGAADDTDDWREQLQVLKNTLAVELEPVATRVFTAIGDALEGALPSIVGFGEAFGDLVETAADSEAINILFDLPQGFGAVSDAVGGFGGAIGGSALALEDLFALDFEGFVGHLDDIGSSAEGMIDSLQVRVGRQSLLGDLRDGEDPTLALANALAFLDRQGELTADTIGQFSRIAGVGPDSILPFLREMADSGVFAGEGLEVLRSQIRDLEQATVLRGVSQAGQAMRDAAANALELGDATDVAGEGLANISTEAFPVASFMDELNLIAAETGASLGELVFGGDEATAALLEMLDPADQLSVRLGIIAEDAVVAGQVLEEALTGSIGSVTGAFVDANEDMEVSASEFFDALLESESVKAEFDTNLLAIATVAPGLATKLKEAGAETAGTVAAGFAEDLDLATAAEEVVLQQSDTIAGVIDSAVETATDLLDTDPHAREVWVAFAASLGIPGLTDRVTRALDDQLDTAVDSADTPAKGRQAALGFIDGYVNTMTTTGVSRIKSATNHAIDQAIEISSPSKLFRRKGVLAGEGFILGVGDELASGNFGFDDLELGGLRDVTVGGTAATGSSGGPLIGSLTVNNPVGEPTEESLQDPGLRAVVGSYLRPRP